MRADWITFGTSLTVYQMLFRIIVAVLIGAVIGYDRETKNRPAGLRTHVLVCLGAALVALVEQASIAYVVNLGSPQINISVGRLTSTVVSGVGFLGAGTIILSGHKIKGLTTAASLWCTACLGLAIGAGFTTMAGTACIVVVIVLRVMQKYIHVHTYKRLEVQFVHRAETLAFIKEVFDEKKIMVLDQDFHAEIKDDTSIYTNVYSLTMPGSLSYQELIEILSEYPNVRAVRTRNV